jgi:hypothetical protein
MYMVFVFEEVLTDYTSGQVVVVAHDLTRAQELIAAECHEGTVESLVAWDPGFAQPTAVYPTTASEERIHACWGGG